MLYWKKTNTDIEKLTKLPYSSTINLGPITVDFIVKLYHVYSLLAKVNSNKAEGPDGLHSKI